MIVVEEGEKMEFTIRISCSDDRERLIYLINSIAHERKYLQTENYIPTPLWEQAINEGINLESGVLLLLLQDLDNIVGYARIYPDYMHPCGRLAGNIGIALLPKYRSQGTGAIMLTKLLSYTPDLGYKIATANVLASNLRSIRLFEKFKFNPVGKRDINRNFLEGLTKEIIFEKSLNE